MDLRDYLALVNDAHTLLHTFSLHTSDSGLQQLQAFHEYIHLRASPWLHYLHGIKPNQDAEQSLHQRYAHLFAYSYPTLLADVIEDEMFIVQWHQLSWQDKKALFHFNPDIYCNSRHLLEPVDFAYVLDEPALSRLVQTFPLLQAFTEVQRAGPLLQLRKKSQGTPFADFFEQMVRQPCMTLTTHERTEYASRYLAAHKLYHGLDWIELLNIDLEEDYSHEPSFVLQQLILQERAYQERLDIFDACIIRTSFSEELSSI